jgi:hypothetical protein
MTVVRLDPKTSTVLFFCHQACLGVRTGARLFLVLDVVTPMAASKTRMLLIVMLRKTRKAFL